MNSILARCPSGNNATRSPIRWIVSSISATGDANYPLLVSGWNPHTESRFTWRLPVLAVACGYDLRGAEIQYAAGLLICQHVESSQQLSGYQVGEIEYEYHWGPRSILKPETIRLLRSYRKTNPLRHKKESRNSLAFAMQFCRERRQRRLEREAAAHRLA